MNERIEASELLLDYYNDRHALYPASEAFDLMQVKAKYGWRDVHRNKADLVIDSACFDVDEVAEKHLKLRVFIESLKHWDKKAGSFVYGLADPRNRIVRICERAEAYLPLYRATMMHEISHMLNDDVAVAAFSPRSPSRPDIERLADRFMVDALLPKPILFLAVTRICDQIGSNSRETLLNANTEGSCYLWKRFIFEELINRLCVSREMIINRMVDQGLFNIDTANYHRRYALKTKYWTPKQKTLQFNFSDEILPEL